MATNPIIVETAQLLKFPAICMRCGRPTPHTIAVKPTAAGQRHVEVALGALSLISPVFHFATAVSALSTANVKIPLCWRCHWNYFLPNRKLLVYVALVPAFLGSAIYSGFQGSNGRMLLYIVLAIACLVYLIRTNRSHEVKTLPVQIFRSGGHYRYVIHGGPLYESLAHAQARDK